MKFFYRGKVGDRKTTLTIVFSWDAKNMSKI